MFFFGEQTFSCFLGSLLSAAVAELQFKLLPALPTIRNHCLLPHFCSKEIQPDSNLF